MARLGTLDADEAAVPYYTVSYNGEPVAVVTSGAVAMARVDTDDPLYAVDVEVDGRRWPVWRG